MKKLLFTLSMAMLCVCSKAQQAEFAPIGAEWYYNYSISPDGYFYRVVSEKDTVVEGSNCRLLNLYYDMSSSSVSEEYIIKQEQGKIYYYYHEQFHLLFDFDVELNDIVEFTFMYKKYDKDNGICLSSYTDTVLSLRFEIKNIATNAQNLKTFTANILDEDKDKIDGVYSYWEHSYTEKIGGNNLFMPMLHNGGVLLGVEYSFLRCYSDADLSYISQYWLSEGAGKPCDYSIYLGVNDVAFKANTFWQHGNYLMFNENVQRTINFYSVMGIKIYSVESTENEINPLPYLKQKGVYIVEIIENGKKYSGYYINL